MNTTCPECGSDNVGDFWQSGRKLRLECRSCDWKGEARTPEMQPDPSVQSVMVTEFGRWEYHIYDQYNHAAVYSQGFATEDECVAEAKKALKGCSKMEGYGVCTAVIWPPRIEVRGQVIKSSKADTTLEGDPVVRQIVQQMYTDEEMT